MPTMPRTPVRDRYDAVLDFHPRNTLPETAYVLLKLTYRIERHGCVLTDPQPLQHDLRDETLQPRMPTGSDFWVQKLGTDVVVQGAACAPGGRPVRTLTCSVQVGNRTKRVLVFGTRGAYWHSGGALSISDPEPFTEIPLTYENAYGGIDPRVPMKLPTDIAELARFDLFNHPGLYPRNPQGRGYLVLPDPVQGALMPNLEDPDDRLTPERLVVRDPSLWYRQPMPWCFDFTHPLMFPRMVFGNLQPAFPAPEDPVLPEIARGLFEPELASLFGRPFNPAYPPLAPFYQEGSLGMVFGQLVPGTPMAVEGMHPDEQRLEWTLPAPPALEVFIERQRVAVTTRITNCIVQPQNKRLMLVYCALVDKMPRVFVPGLHKDIPFSIVVDRDEPLSYEPPKPIHEQIDPRRA